MDPDRQGQTTTTRASGGSACLAMRLPFLALACAAAATLASAQGAGTKTSEYPPIGRLSPRDLVFKQVQDSLSQGYQAEKNAGEYPDLFICRWTAVGGEDFFSVAARLSIPYETLATLNGLGRPREFAPGETVLVPSVAGLFVPDAPRTDLDMLLSARSHDPTAQSKRISLIVAGRETLFSFYPGARLYQTERSFFLNVGFRMPLPEGVFTSGYGFRRSPIDGHDRMHEGIDLAAPYGTDVMAAREGIIEAVGEDPTLGMRVIIDHGGGIRTIYGHLSSVSIELNQTVRSGTILGAVGSSGLSTGPHLHFEIRLSGKARDPSSYLPGLKP
jgi:murein DD-endopeptidase MepM/ murein hydrolase activator NlpD